MATPPEGRQPRRSDDRHSVAREGPRPADDDARLAPGEREAIDRSVVRVGRRGRGPIIAAVVVAAAFALGVLRPWDLLGGMAARPAVTTPAGETGTTAAGSPGRAPSAEPGSAAGSLEPAPQGLTQPTCGYPVAWRTAAVQQWAGRRARVWTAAEAVLASGPEDPAIPFHPIASDVVEAIGWCAPVRGDDRPPLTAVGTLFRIRDGVATEVAVDRLEPATQDALGELWLPKPLGAGRRPTWLPGRYVIRLATPAGSYVRYLGLEVGIPERETRPVPTSDPPQGTGTTPPSDRDGSGGPPRHPEASGSGSSAP